MSKLKKNILSAMFLALLIVLSRFLSIKTPILVISFSFIPIILSAILLGPKYSTIIAALGDLIGALLFPFGSYFPGYTLSQALIGLIYGLFLYENKPINDGKFVVKLILSSILALIGVGIFITGIWVHITVGKAYIAVLSTRAIAQLAMLPIQVIIIFSLRKVLKPMFEKYL